MRDETRTMTREQTFVVDTRPFKHWLRHGSVVGILAGIIFAIFEMLINVVQGQSFFGPLRLISSIVLGPEATQATYPLATAAIAGVIVHMILSALYGVVFVYALVLTRQLGVSTALLLFYGSLVGFLLWVTNFIVIAPLLFPQFTQVNQFLHGFVAHTFFYGTVLGVYVAAVRPGRATVEIPGQLP
ncbi:MAG: hypothetical protein L0332_18790 [Chloroflexi bacterium]|nr:hypothetical protein [Chloroflexota bacterium]MCI0578539.1 hypothetical protein [Chloroflexota bacterium]MCI0647465.1 hypothetical protein [Chloroflexota bacterium]MCI0728745.1 hypothetical protein [Chloroflexota bacterium]